jgi:hypothetical protein
MTRRKWMIFGVVAGMFLALFWTVAVRHQTPAGQPPLADLTHQSLSQLRQEFNAAPDSDPGCCTQNGTLWDVIAVYPPGARWTETLPAPQFFAGPVVRGAPLWDAKVTGNDSRADSSRP